MDAAFMNGDTLAQGAVGAIENVMHAVSVARALSHEHCNSFRVGKGATKFASLHGFEMTNMLTKRAKKRWQKRCKEIEQQNLNPYDGHDTVGAITLDKNNSMAAATSTSGLFMKKMAVWVILHYLVQVFMLTVKLVALRQQVLEKIL